jgi:phosphocarrier protein
LCEYEFGGDNVYEFSYTIKDEIGIHARPAGMLVQIAKNAKSDVTMECKGKSADLKKIFSLMALSVKCNDTVTVKVNGEDEKEVSERINKYLTENL